MARQLLNVKESTSKEVWKCAARLHCMESFLYKRLNEIIYRAADTEPFGLWKKELPPLSAFACILYQLGSSEYTNNRTIVYRCANLSEELIESYQEKCTGIDSHKGRFYFHTFVPTSNNRNKAEHTGNVLFIIDIVPSDGWDMSSYSEYDEDEYLLRSEVHLYFQSCAFDKDKKKWIFHIKSRF